MVALSKGEYCFLYQTTDKWKSIVLQALPFSVHAKVVLSYKEEVLPRDLLSRFCIWAQFSRTTKSSLG